MHLSDKSDKSDKTDSKIIIWCYPKSSCLIQEMISRCPIDITIEPFLDQEQMINFAVENSFEEPDYIIDFSNPKEDNKYIYSRSIKQLLAFLNAFSDFNKIPFVVVASTVGVLPRFIDLGNQDQLEYNADRAQAEREFHRSNLFGLILRIPLVACRDDSLLKRFKNGTTQEIKNPTKKIPVMAPEPFLKATFGFMRSFLLAKELKMNIIEIDYRSQLYSIEELQQKLSSSNVLDFLIR